MTSLQLLFYEMNALLLGIKSTRGKKRCSKERGCVRESQSIKKN